MLDEEFDVLNVARATFVDRDSRCDAFHGQEVLGSGNSDAQILKLRQVPCHDLLLVGDKSFGAVVEPVFGKVKLALDTLGQSSNHGCGVKNRVDIFGARPCLEGKDHDASSQQA